jgi:hypothetical protein
MIRRENGQPIRPRDPRSVEEVAHRGTRSVCEEEKKKCSLLERGEDEFCARDGDVIAQIACSAMSFSKQGR